MKYYVGTISVRDGSRRYRELVCIAASNEQTALDWLENEAAHLWGGDGKALEPGVYSYEQGDYAAATQGVREVSAATFQELSEMHPVVGGAPRSQLEDEDAAEQVRTLALRIGRHLAKSDAKVAHSRLLHAVAASLGEQDWQVLAHRHAPPSAAPLVAETASQALPSQDFIPGTGYLYRVPVTVDTTTTAFVLVRARSQEYACALARSFALEGRARFDVDEGNYRGLCDHYVSDPAAVERLEDNEPPLPATAQDNALRAQRGAYLVELADLGGEDDDLLWADLTVFDPGEEDPSTEACLSACPRDASPQQAREFCARVAQLLHRAVPNPGDADWQTLQHAFIQAVQGEQSEAAFAAVEAKLRQAR